MFRVEGENRGRVGIVHKVVVVDTREDIAGEDKALDKLVDRQA